MRRAALVLVGACYSPSPPAGSPCDPQHPCPAPLVCSSVSSTCVASDPGTDAPSAPGKDAGADSPASLTNDTATGATDVTFGGTFTANMLLAHDDALQRLCGGDGGRDVFYTINLIVPQVYYFDTFGSDHDTSLRVFKGLACTSVTNQGSSCSDDACNSGASQLATLLPAGPTCVIVDSNAGATKGGMTLHVVPGGHTGDFLPGGVQQRTGDTCNDTSDSNPVGACAGFGPGAKDHAYFFTICPNDTRTISATTCASPVPTNTMIYVQKVGVANVLACNNDDSTCGPLSTITNVDVQGPGLAWLVVDGFSTATCGAYTLDTSLD